MENSHRIVVTPPLAFFPLCRSSQLHCVVLNRCLFHTHIAYLSFASVLAALTARLTPVMSSNLLLCLPYPCIAWLSRCFAFMFASLVFRPDLLSPLLVVPLYCVVFPMFCFHVCIACFPLGFAFHFACRTPALRGFSDVLLLHLHCLFSTQICFPLCLSCSCIVVLPVLCFNRLHLH